MLPNADRVVLSRWHSLFEDFSTSTQEFYAAVEETIRRRNIPEIEVSRMFFNEGGIGTAKREYLRVRRNRVAFDICSAPYGNGHFFSWWLAKVPAKYGLFIIAGIMCLFLPIWCIFSAVAFKVFEESCLGALLSILFLFFGIPIILLSLGFLVERGLIGSEEWVTSIPYVGALYLAVFNPLTYYRLDTAQMFCDSISSAVGEVLNGLREEKGLRLLGEAELKPERFEQPAE